MTKLNEKLKKLTEGKNPKCRAGRFSVYHAGPSHYEVIDVCSAEIVAVRSNLSDAFAQARTEADMALYYSN